MHRTILIGAASALTLMAGACGTNEEAPQNEMAAANDMNRMMADPNNPFAQAEAQMHERMMAAAGADPSETWIRKMIEHHRGAVAMSDIVLAQNPTPQVRAEALRALETIPGVAFGPDAAWQAHHRLLVADIKRFNDRPLEPVRIMPLPQPPPGAPIGDPGMYYCDHGEELKMFNLRLKIH